MKTCVYFAETGEKQGAVPWLALGYGFTAAGLWRRMPLPETAAALVLDDRFLPEPQGLEEARRVLDTWPGALLLDFERPPVPRLLALQAELAGRDLAVPPAYAAGPHSAVLTGPWIPGPSFSRWLEAQRKRWGPLVLDGAPVRCLCKPGATPIPWEGPLPEQGFPCGSGCLHRRMEDGALLFWDTRESLLRRAEEAGLPFLIYRQDWEALTP